MKFNIPAHIKRLVLVFLIFISLFLLLRHLLIPASFGKYGHYRAESITENSSLQPHYAGQAACFECHQDIEDIKAQDVHSGLHCEICHGPGVKHIASADTADIIKPSGRDFCGKCHGLNIARPGNIIKQIDLNKHNVGKSCTDCHNPHEPWKKRK